jgi:hypothetical protein
MPGILIEKAGQADRPHYPAGKNDRLKGIPQNDQDKDYTHHSNKDHHRTSM